MPNRNDSAKWALAIAAIVVLVLSIPLTTVVLAVQRPDLDTLVVVGAMVAFVSPTVVALLALLKSLENSQTLARNTSLTETTTAAVADLANGGLDSKVRAAVADVVNPSYLRSDAAPLIDEDRRKRRELYSWVEGELRHRLESDR